MRRSSTKTTRAIITVWRRSSTVSSMFAISTSVRADFKWLQYRVLFSVPNKKKTFQKRSFKMLIVLKIQTSTWIIVFTTFKGRKINFAMAMGRHRSEKIKPCAGGHLEGRLIKETVTQHHFPAPLLYMSRAMPFFSSSPIVSLFLSLATFRHFWSVYHVHCCAFHRWHRNCAQRVLPLGSSAASSSQFIQRSVDWEQTAGCGSACVPCRKPSRGRMPHKWGSGKAFPPCAHAHGA